MSGTITPSLNQGLFLGSTSGTITVQAIATAGTHTVTLPAQTGTVAVELIGTTGTIGGGALAAGASASGTVAVAGATTGMAVVVSPAANPQVDANHALSIWGYVSSTGTVTVNVGAIVATTPVGVVYNVRVIQ
jgi:hypothetical protein